MKLLKIMVLILFFLYSIALSQDSDTLLLIKEKDTTDNAPEENLNLKPALPPETGNTDSEQNTSVDTAAIPLNTPESIEIPYNPFVAEQNETMDTGLTQQEPPPMQTADESDSRSIDILLDLSAGFGYSHLFDVSPKHYTLSGKGNFLFSLGVMLPFCKVCFAELSVSYFQVSYSSAFTTPDAIDMYAKRKGTETLNFLSAPLDIGLRFDFGVLLPSLYCRFEPAYLTSAGRFTETEIYATFSDNTYLASSSSENADITMDRERHQIFIGAGAGIEFNYGYGSIYINGGFHYPLLQPGDENSKPERSSSKFINFPFALGIRFYL